MSTAQLGRLERVALREAWPNESQNFTPWLAKAENLCLLGEAIGVELQPHGEEEAVGPFRADILCRDIETDSFVLVENQLERTDHSHLGQLLTYAAGLHAVTVVWIAERFTDEHRAALDWLNEKTPEDVAFFGLEVELWKIGDSQLAPKFNVVSRPNDWSRQVAARASSGNLETQQLCWDFWSGVISALDHYGALGSGTKPCRRKDIRFDVGWHTFSLKAYFSSVGDKKQGVWVSCRGQRGYENYLVLEECRGEIEQAFGEPLEWRSLADDNRGTLMAFINGHDIDDRSSWPAQQEAVAAKVAKLYEVLQALIVKLDRQIKDGVDAS